MNAWELIQSIYQKNFGIPPRIVNLMSLESVLEACANGKSITSIAGKFGWSPLEVSNVLSEYLDFPGWETDLDISPLSMYNSYGKDFRVFRYNILTFTKMLTRRELITSFYICKKFGMIRKEIDKYIK